MAGSVGKHCLILFVCPVWLSLMLVDLEIFPIMPSYWWSVVLIGEANRGEILILVTLGSSPFPMVINLTRDSSNLHSETGTVFIGTSYTSPR